MELRPRFHQPGFPHADPMKIFRPFLTSKAGDPSVEHVVSPYPVRSRREPQVGGEGPRIFRQPPSILLGVLLPIHLHVISPMLCNLSPSQRTSADSTVVPVAVALTLVLHESHLREPIHSDQRYVAPVPTLDFVTISNSRSLLSTPLSSMDCRPSQLWHRT